MPVGEKIAKGDAINTFMVKRESVGEGYVGLGFF